jgi:hypothetical protein
MPSTYDKIETYTVPSATSSYTFTSIPSTYTDLVLVTTGSQSGASSPNLRVGNGSIDTGSNYSYTYVYGTGSSALSARAISETSINPAFNPATNEIYNCVYHIMNYSNTTTFKTMLSRGNAASSRTVAEVGLWRSTAAINQVRIFDAFSNLNTGSTFTLYGIKAA